jgi:hypothetical protein
MNATQTEKVNEMKVTESTKNSSTRLDGTISHEGHTVRVSTIGAMTQRAKHYITVQGVYGDTQSVEIRATKESSEHELSRVKQAGELLILASMV